jgi:16S rRNA (guanine527-N7)-methyltransferase
MSAVAAACRASVGDPVSESQVTCLDSNGKKTRFLTQVKLELKLDNLQVIHSRVEAFQPAQPFNGIISRAFSSMENFTNWTRHLGDTDTRWLAMKGVHPPMSW